LFSTILKQRHIVLSSYKKNVSLITWLSKIIFNIKSSDVVIDKFSYKLFKAFVYSLFA